MIATSGDVHDLLWELRGVLETLPSCLDAVIQLGDLWSGRRMWMSHPVPTDSRETCRANPKIRDYTGDDRRKTSCASMGITTSTGSRVG